IFQQMGCGASADSQVSRQSSAQSTQRGRAYHRLMLEEENEAGEYVDVTSAAFQQSLPIAPFSFSRPDSKIQPIPSVPCLEAEHLELLPHTQYWDRCGKRRQLYRGAAENRTQNPGRWTFYNDSRDLNCHVKFVFDPANATEANSVEILSSEAVSRTSRDGFITFTVCVEPLQTTAALSTRSVASTAFMVVYDVEEFTDSDFVAKNREHSQKKWVAQCRALDKMIERNKLTPQQVSDADCVRLCVQQNVTFVDQRVGLDGSCEYLTPDQFLLPMEADEVRPFRSAVSSLLIKRNILCVVHGRLKQALPTRCQRIFHHPISLEEGLREREHGAFRLTICDESLWRKEVIVDNYFPISGGKHVGVSRQDPCEVWPQLITKALKKVQGSGDFLSRSALSFVEQLSGSVVHTFPGWKSKLARRSLSSGLSIGTVVRIRSHRGICDAANTQLFLLENVYLVPQRKLCLLRLSCPPWKSNVESLASFSRWSDTSNAILTQFPELEKDIRRSKPLDSDLFVNLTDVSDKLTEMITCFYQSPESNFRVQGTFNGNFPPVPSVSLSIRSSRTVELCFSLRVPFESGRRVLLSVFSSTGETVFGGALRYELLSNSSGNPAKRTASKFSFSTHTCILRVRLEPSKVPYLVVPRLLGEDEPDASFRPAEHGHIGHVVTPAQRRDVIPGLDYVLTIESTADLLSGVDISLRAIDGESKIFDSVDSVLIGNASSVLVSSSVQSFDGASLLEKNVNNLAAIV
ncbi:calpain-like cysteine peptidase, putative, partial [Bodo saltans]